MKHTAARRLVNGFTLIELMIVVAIIAILASIAYPSYQEQIAKGRRTEARVELSQAQQWLERFYSEHYSYTTATNGTAMATLFAAQPFRRAPREGTAVYNLTVTATVSAYTLTAVPISPGPMATDVCGTYTSFSRVASSPTVRLNAACGSVFAFLRCIVVKYDCSFYSPPALHC